MVDVIIFLVIVVLIVVGIVLNNKTDYFFFEVLTVFSGISLAVYLVLWPHFVLSSQNLILQYHSVQNTLKEFRSNGEYIERTSVFSEVAKINAQLEMMKYWNNHGFDLWCLDEVEKLDPLK